MKTIKFLLAALLSAAITQAADSVKVYLGAADTLLRTSGINRPYSTPCNIQTVWTAGSVYHTKSDTVPVNCHNIVGPIPLTNGSGKPLYAGFLQYGDVNGTTPAGETRFQVTPTSSLSDTLTGHWVIIDTLDDDGEVDYHVLDSTNIGNFMWIDHHNYDATATVFKNRLLFKSAETYATDPKK